MTGWNRSGGDRWQRDGLAECTRLEQAYRAAVKERRLAEDWTIAKNHRFVMPLTHRQMLGRALALKGTAGEGEYVAIGANDLSDTGINKAYQVLLAHPHPKAIDEFISMLELFDMRLIDTEQRMVPQTDINSVAAILRAS